MNKEGKVWGTTTEIYCDDHISVNYLEIKRGGYCSEHRHALKTNIFLVLEGELIVKVWTEKGALVDLTRLRAGQELHVLPGHWHQFEARAAVRCVEIYRARLYEPDIERRSVGGERR